MKLRYVQAGEIVTTHGVRGEVKVLPWSDGPAFLMGFSRVRIRERDYQVESCRIQKNCNLLKLRGVDTLEAAQALRGKTVEVYREEAPEGVIFADELIGMTVLWEGKPIGTVAEVLDYPGNMVYVIRGVHTYLVPAVKEFVPAIDLDKNEMQVRLIEGMESDEN